MCDRLSLFSVSLSAIYSRHENVSGDIWCVYRTRVLLLTDWWTRDVLKNSFEESVTETIMPRSAMTPVPAYVSRCGRPARGTPVLGRAFALKWKRNARRANVTGQVNTSWFGKQIKWSTTPMADVRGAATIVRPSWKQQQLRAVVEQRVMLRLPLVRERFTATPGIRWQQRWSAGILTFRTLSKTQ